MTSTTPTNVTKKTNEVCVGPVSQQAGKASTCEGCPNQSNCLSGVERNNILKVKSDAQIIASKFSNIKNILLILSGKGGVGKSTVSSQLAFVFASWGLQVGVLDIDICGPSIPKLMGVEDKIVRNTNNGWIPVYKEDNLAIMSIGFLLDNSDQAVIWRGSRKTNMIGQFLMEVEWDGLDFLIIDAPPGTSDEHIAIVQNLSLCKNVGSVIVSTPQELSVLDVTKEIVFCKKVKLPIYGIIENMSGFKCPCCNNISDIFIPTTGGCKTVAKKYNINYLGNLPLDKLLLKCCEQGQSFIKTVKKSKKDNTCLKKLVHIAEYIIKIIENNNKNGIWNYVNKVRKETENSDSDSSDDDEEDDKSFNGDKYNNTNEHM